jgi:pSer/pThr/pTyr-binding forkhead associated (FHA) protein
MQSRLVGFIILGAAIGFFISLIAEAFKRVWVKVLIGRNEGREHVLDQPVAYVGRDELAEVPVFLDPAVPKRMASFRLSNGRYGLYPESNALPIVVNGQPLAPGQILRDGDAIQFGRVTLAYNEKATATGSVRPVDTIALADFSVASVIPGAVPIPNAPNVCEFCGQQRDPTTGGCACTVPADGGYAAPAGYGPPGYDAGGYAQPPTMAYGQDFGQGGFGQPGYADPGYGQPAYADPAYAATVMDPGGYGAPAAPAGSGPRLVAFEGPYAGQVFPLMAAEAGIGRDPAQDISLSQDTTTSRRHARIYNAGNGWVVRDEGSSNGTWITGVRIQEQALFPGDAVRVGHTQFRFEV